MNLKTSTKISIKFTIFTIIIVFLFGLFANMVFLQRWYAPLRNNIKTITNISTIQKPRINGMGVLKDHFRNDLTINIDSQEYMTIKKNIVINNICKMSDSFFYFQEIGKKVIVINITPHVIAQKNLFYTTLYLLILFWILAYFISLYFVKSSLSKLNNLVEHVKKLDVDNLHQKIKIDWPENDEINILAIKMNDALDKIYTQTIALKDFVSNASHELKTPLMSINSEIDYAVKSKKYKEWLDNTKLELKNMNNLLDELVLISKLDSQIKLDKKEKNISDVVSKYLKYISKNYWNKNIKIIKKIESVDKFVHNSSFDIIAKNLIENAFKYTDKWNIEIILNDKKFVVKDSWVWIEKKNLEKIWDRFWQEDSSKTDTKSFWLWLYLTKLLVEKHWWNIEVISKKLEGSEFKIIF